MTPVQFVIAVLGSLALVAGIFVGLVYWANWDIITRDWKKETKR
ncbi:MULTISPECIES: hypothetical protein [Ursidibacter]|nr:hypothetical protein [Ursidibacter maritimus]